MIGQKLPICAAIVPGRRRIPTPTVPPKITASPKLSPRMRERDVRELAAMPSAEISGATDIFGFLMFVNRRMKSASVFSPRGLYSGQRGIVESCNGNKSVGADRLFAPAH